MTDKLVTVVIQMFDDDKAFSARDWQSYMGCVNAQVELFATRLKFRGSNPCEWYMRECGCWVFEMPEHTTKNLRDVLWTIARRFRKNGVTWLQGEPDPIYQDPTKYIKEVAAQSGEVF